jgi:hypothetical protein
MDDVRVLNLLILSINGIVIKPAGTAAIAKTPNNLLELYVKFGKLGRNTIR